MEHKKHAGHGYVETHIKHHHDGSHTVKHLHEDGTSKEHAKANLDGVHDSLQDHLGQMNPGEQEANEGQHGVPAEAAQAAGLPAAAQAGV